MAILRVKAGPNKGKVYEVRDESLEVGRDVPAGIQVMDQGVSRRHAEIFRIGELFFIRDLESRNGTFVNEKPIKEEILRIGDQIRIGNTVLVFEDRSAQLRDSSRIIADDPVVAEKDLGATIQLKLTKPSKDKEAAGHDTPESRNLNVLFHLAFITSEEKDISRLLGRSVELLASSIDADHIYILWARDDQGEGFEILARFDRQGAGGAEGSVSRSIVRDCLRFGRSILTSDASLDGQFNVMASVVMKQLRSVICVPIPLLGKNVGVLYIHSRRPEAFPAEMLELASAVGIQLGVTIGLLKMVQSSDRFFRDSVKTLVSAIEMRSPETRGRSERVATYCLAIAKELGLETTDVRNAWLAGMLHDIGSIPMSDKDRQQALTAETKKNHYARELLRTVKGLDAILPAVEGQSERHDGSGSPEGKEGDAIPLLARILGLALELDGNLYHGSAGGEEMTVKDALIKLRETADRQFHRETVNALLRAYRNGKLFNPEEEFFEIPLS